MHFYSTHEAVCLFHYAAGYRVALSAKVSFFQSATIWTSLRLKRTDPSRQTCPISVLIFDFHPAKLKSTVSLFKKNVLWTVCQNLENFPEILKVVAWHSSRALWFWEHLLLVCTPDGSREGTQAAQFRLNSLPEAPRAYYCVIDGIILTN